MRRGYNQAALLARGIAARTGLRPEEGALVRKRRTRPQSKLPPRERSENVAGAFGVRAGVGLAGREIVLVDDLVTTGRTALACARVALGAGAAAVLVLAAGRSRETCTGAVPATVVGPDDGAAGGGPYG